MVGPSIMIDITTGLIEETLLLIRLIDHYECSSMVELKQLFVSGGISLTTSVEFAKQCKWINEADGIIKGITRRAEEYLKEFDGRHIPTNLWKRIIMDHIIDTMPSWSSRIPAGRKEAFLFMPADVQRCFNEAGLMERPATEIVIEWWEKASGLIRSKQNISKTKTGRRGELCTISYEYKRTGRVAIWESFETNLVGYDVLSVVDSTSEDKLLIEVKSSTRSIGKAEMIVSRNEWETASRNIEGCCYRFYLWVFSEETKMCIISPDELIVHIPNDEGDGKWEDVSIPFKAFENRFVKVDCE